MEAFKLSTGIRDSATSVQALSLTLLSHHDNSQQRLEVHADLHISEFLEQLLASLAEGENRERVAQMRKCYEPVLELVRRGSELELEGELTLKEAGIVDGDTIQIAARPLKEKLLFCRYSKLSA